MRSHERMLRLLDLFDGQALGWTFEQLHEKTQYTRSTLYRYLRVLSESGLLTSLPRLGYTLGPRIIELDYKIRSGDPLIRAAEPVMEELAEQVPGVVLLCRRYGHRVLCVHQQQSTELVRSGYERGRARPLTRGAASIVILAYLPPAQIAKLFARIPDEFRDGHLGSTLNDVKENLKAIRQAGWSTTTGHVSQGITGIAAPLFDGGDDVLGSLSVSVPASNRTDASIKELADRVRFCSSIVTKALRRQAASQPDTGL